MNAQAKKNKLTLQVYAFVRELNQRVELTNKLELGVKFLTDTDIEFIDSTYRQWILCEQELGDTRKVLDDYQTFAQKGNRIFKNSADSREEMFLANIKHSDPRMLRFRRNLYERLTKEVPPSSKSKYGVCDANAVPGDWTKLLSVTGQYPNKVGYGFRDNFTQRKKEGLPLDFYDETDKKLTQLFFEVLLESFSYELTKFQDKSLSGPPDYTYGAAGKLIKALHAMAHFDEVHELVTKGDNVTLAERYHAMIAYSAGNRTQIDRAGKKRYYVTFDDGYHSTGEKKLVDNKVYLGPEADGFVTMRWRNVFGLSNVLNSLMQQIISCVLNGFSSRFSKTFKVTKQDVFEEQINTAVNYFTSVGETPMISTADVSNFDMYMPGFVVDLFFDVFEKRYGSKLSDICRITRVAPVLYPPRDGSDTPLWMGDPLDPLAELKNISPPHRSGIAYVTCVNKACGSADMFSRLNRALEALGVKERSSWTKRDIIALLDWEVSIIPFCGANSGDDQKTIARNEAIRKQYDSTPGWWFIGVEPSTLYVGLVSYYDPLTTRIRQCHDITTYVTNFINPEHGSQHKHNQYLGVGLFERRDIYSDAPMYNKVNVIMDEEFAKVFKGYPKLTYLIDAKYEEDRLKLEQTFSGRLTKIEAEVLADPDKLQWKYTSDNDDISEEVRALIAQSLTPRVMMAYCKPSTLVHVLGDNPKLFKFEETL